MCTCITDIDAKLKESGACLETTMPLRSGEVPRAIISLIRLDKWAPETRRGKPKSFLASFCPWCGEKYPDGAATGAQP